MFSKKWIIFSKVEKWKYIFFTYEIDMNEKNYVNQFFFLSQIKIYSHTRKSNLKKVQRLTYLLHAIYIYLIKKNNWLSTLNFFAPFQSFKMYSLIWQKIGYTSSFQHHIYLNLVLTLLSRTSNFFPYQTLGMYVM